MDNARLTDIMAMQGGGVVSIVGGGGKTTLMERLAREITARGETVLVTTTTKIMIPPGERPERIIISQAVCGILKQAKIVLFASGRLTAASSCLAGGNKLVGFEAAQITELEQGRLFDWILVEADGARRLPLKAPAPHEPVMPPSSRWVVGVIGLDAVGRPLTNEWVFRSDLFHRITGLAPGAAITEESVAALIEHEQGIFKDCPDNAAQYIFLNKAETEDRRIRGRRIAHLLQKGGQKRLRRVIIGALQQDAEPLEWYDNQ